MNLITGAYATTDYIDQNVHQSGIEMWRKLNRNSDPRTYNTTDAAHRTGKAFGTHRSKNVKELL